MKSKLSILNDELIAERLHSQHLSTKLHSHEVNSKHSMLWGMAEKLDVTTPPMEEAVITCATVGIEKYRASQKKVPHETTIFLNMK